MKKVLSLLVAFVFAMTTGISAQATPTPKTPHSITDWSIPGVYSLPRCINPIDRDCIDEIYLVDQKGEYEKAVNFEDVNGLTGTRDYLGNLRAIGPSVWKAEVDGVPFTVSISSRMQSPAYQLTPQIKAGALYLDVDVQNDQTGGTTDDNLTTSVIISFKTSWMKPAYIGLKGRGATIQQTPILGGSSWTFVGSGVHYDISNHLGFTIMHADTVGLFSKTEISCAKYGFYVSSSNIAGWPKWNSSGKYFEFLITWMDPAEDPFFNFVVHEKYLNCMFPKNTVTKAANVSADVISKYGDVQIGTYQATKSNGQIYVSASNFKYGQQLRIRLAPTQNLTCLKITNSKVIEKVSGISPKCPVGFKKKS